MNFRTCALTSLKELIASLEVRASDSHALQVMILTLQGAAKEVLRLRLEKEKK